MMTLTAAAILKVIPPYRLKSNNDQSLETRISQASGDQQSPFLSGQSQKTRINQLVQL